MIAATIALLTLAYIAYRSSTPGTGDVLFGIVLAFAAFFTLLSIPKLDWQDQQAETYREIIDDVRARLPVTVKFTSAREAPVELAAEAAPVSVGFAEPEVHRVDADLVEEAKRMASEGAAIDDICRLIDPDHDSHDPLHREAFRRIVQAMIDES